MFKKIVDHMCMQTVIESLQDGNLISVNGQGWGA